MSFVDGPDLLMKPAPLVRKQSILTPALLMNQRALSLLVLRDICFHLTLSALTACIT